MKKHYTLLLTLVFSLITIIAQDHSEELNFFHEKYPNENLVIISHVEEIDISKSKNGLQITIKFNEEKLYLQDNANLFSEEKISGSSFHKLSEIKASSLIFNGKNYKEQKINNFNEKDKLDNAIFHDDVKEISFYYPNLNKGSKSNLSYTTSITDPRFLTSFFFQEYYPINEVTYKMTVDKDINIGFKEFNTDNFKIEHTVEEKKNKKIYTWKSTHVPKTESESNAPSFFHSIPHITPYIESYSENGQTIPILGSTKKLYDWYYSLTKDFYEKNDTIPEIKSLIDSLIADINSDEEKLKVIYYWVQENIKYVAFESGLGGFIPRSASSVYNKRFGDCKDNSSILKEMLEYAGLNTYLTWVGTRRLPYSYSQISTPVVDNHMINTCIIDSNFYYLDATGKYATIDMIASFIQDKEVLIGIDVDSFIVKKLPITNAERNYFNDTVALELNNLDLVGNGKYTVNGYPKIKIFNHLETLKDDNIKKFYTINLTKGNNKFIINSFVETNKFDYDKPFELSYDFSVASYATLTDNHLYINLNLHKDFIPKTIKKDRTHAIEQDYCYKKSYYYKLKIPEQYEVEYIPENVHVNTKDFSFNLTYKVEGEYIIYESSFKEESLLIEKNQFLKWNKFIQQVQSASKEVVVLKHK
ncbi:MAG: DUF3857 and transglutaminase domain-containing protein [Flavobacteriales bacterium]|nr:DUF3857 and transglutaminase domain-containing protein [Flavobacteriales bacterium]MCW8913928.1 DUF3857 and transglutaminase domain-containing protein [Flavobacteriales bacterium]MCW8937272.1 DUF3857 and transglutaminase domain-containing protein [Flavobacteriales bacterium]MCW8967212.1 DUF3857 and transglutaminase domain-containing protein [Flavobacteriales bacterium]MCW9021084.1 DUF3857 and transglutaminase domain-containing protein [Flavobacteriales bacterium]